MSDLQRRVRRDNIAEHSDRPAQRIVMAVSSADGEHTLTLGWDVLQVVPGQPLYRVSKVGASWHDAVPYRPSNPAIHRGCQWVHSGACLRTDIPRDWVDKMLEEAGGWPLFEPDELEPLWAPLEAMFAGE